MGTYRITPLPADRQVPEIEGRTLSAVVTAATATNMLTCELHMRNDRRFRMCRIDAESVYWVLAPAEHPIEEAA